MLGSQPTQADIDAHLAQLAARGRLIGSVPVLWDMTPLGLGQPIFWELISALRSYQEDLEDWRCIQSAGGRHAYV